jgi:DNA polymerase III delta subunit
MTDSVPSLAYFWGEDAYGLADAARRLEKALAERDGQPVEVWRTSGDEDEGGSETGNGSGKRRARILDQIEQRLSTATLFGGGTLVLVRQPQSLIRESAARERLIALLPQVGQGNALCFVDLIAAGGKGPAQAGMLRDAVAAHKGLVREFPALTRERMEVWVGARAKELDVTLGPGAAHMLAERIGAYVREGDVDRRRQAELANAELEKLALYRPEGAVSREDVAELVSEAVPGSTWALLDAVGSRRGGEAALLIERLLNDGSPIPVLITQLHRRLRELIVIRDHLAAGTKPPDLVRELKLQPYRAQKLTEQARAWQPEELDNSLGALLDLDLLSKGIATDGSPHSMSDDRSRLALVAWVGENVARLAESGAGGRR